MATRQGVPLDPLNDLDDVEQQAAGGGVRLDQLDPEPIAQAIGFAGPFADQELAALVMAEEFLAEAADRDQAVGAGAVERDEQAKARHRGDTAGEGGADMGRHIRCDIAIHGAALGRHCAPLAHGKMLAEFLEASLVGLAETAFAQAIGRDQRAVHDQVGKAADR